MCNAFASHGHQVELWVTNRHTQIALSPEEYYGTTLNFLLERVTVIDLVGKVYLFPHFLGKFIFQFERLQFIIGFIIRIRKINFNVIYSRDEWLLFFLSFFFTQTSLVYESHEAKYNFAARRILKKGIRCVCISEGIFNSYKEKGVPVDQMIVAHDGVDDSFFSEHISKKEAQEKLGIVQERPVAMYIGGFDQWKGVETFFKASELLPEVQFVAIGGKPHQISRYSSAYPRVLFLGSRPYKELVFHQRAADVLVIPNTLRNDLSAKYTSPLKLFAHMTSGVPMVVSNIPSIQSVLSSEESFFFRADDQENLSEIIQKVIHDPEMAQKKAKAALEISKKYTWKARAENILAFIM